jgi:chromosome segregation ATPase
LDVNPVEDMALLDKLIELQHQDQEYDNEQRQDLNKIDEVRGQIEEKESLLQQLKENLKIYHNMKEKYDLLMVEVQSLEAEKTRLATELNHALMDPTKGCSKSIQKKLEMVESNLTKARLETKKHQDMYRKAEQEAQRCHELEQKITLLKHDHVSLMKKQREAASRHREFVDAKKREIEVLKRNERKTVYKVSKLEAEIHKHKANLIKRNNYCEKLSEKLKETEHRLMKLLSTKKQERPGNAKSMTQKIDSQPMGDMTEMDTPMIDDIASLNVLVQNLVSDQGVSDPTF